MVAVAAATAILLQAPAAAWAHAADRGFVLLLPTDYYLIGGAMAVALSFLILSLMSPEPLAALAGKRLTLVPAPERGRTLASFFGAAVLAALLVAGALGSRDPLSNPLPLVFWTPWWVGLTLLQGLAGNLWSWINPWYGPWRLWRRLSGRDALLRLPRRMGYAPAILIFLAFAWFELAYPAPDDPQILAGVLGAYWLATFAGTALFGYDPWMRRVECFSVFLRMIGRLAVLERRESGEGRWRFVLRAPGAGLVEAPPLPPSGALFLLLALATVSFDGLMRTFFWLGLTGVNPLEFPGRSAVMPATTAGLVLTFAVLAAAFFLCVSVGNRIAGKDTASGNAAGRLVWSIIPISLAYHFAHYLTLLVIDGQYALAAISDPLANGLNLFGTAGFYVRAGIIAGSDSAWVIWNLQAAAIIAGHMLAVMVAHAIAHDIHRDPGRAALSQIPLAVLMVFYTIFGLWLLSSPTI